MNAKKAGLMVAALAVGLYLLRVYYFAGCVYGGEVRLDGKTVLITGANTGIGLETARDLAGRGARVIMGCRSATRCSTAKIDILRTTPGAQLDIELFDLSSLQSVREFATRFAAKEPRLHILVNNAGYVAANQYTETSDGFETTLAINHLGHFLLTHLLLDLLRASAPSRIVIVSSGAHLYGWLDMADLNRRRSFSIFGAYSQSKLANVLHARELSRRLKGTGVTVVSLHPGAVATDLIRRSPAWVRAVFHYGQNLFVKTPWEGAQTTLHCVLDPSVVEHSGEYYSDCVPKYTGPGSNDTEAVLLWEATKKMLPLA